MKKAIFIFLFFCNLSFFGQEKINWISFEKAVELNKTNPKPFVVSIYTNWCGWCKKMDATTYKNSVIIKAINTNYYAVKLNGEQPTSISYKEYTFQHKQQGKTKYHELAALLMNGKLAYPTTVILNKEEKLLNRTQGYVTPKDLEKLLAYFIKKDRKTKDWGRFSKRFKSEIN